MTKPMLARSQGWLMLTLASVLYACYVGYRVPGDWALNYFQVNWWDGFGRRSLLGTLLYPLGCDLFNFKIIAGIQFGVLGLCIASFIWVALGRGLAEVAPLFFLSAAGGYLFHEVGYVDQVLWLLGGLALWLVSRGRDMLAALTLCVSMLTHEMSLFQVIPLVVALLLTEPRQSWRRYVMVLAPALGVFLVIWLKLQTVDEATVLRYFRRVFACGYAIHRTDFYSIFLHRFADRMKFYYSWSEVETRIVPLMVFAAVSLVKVPKGSLNRHLWRLLGLWACSVAPLSLGLLGWDTDRWFFLTFVQIILVQIVLRAQLDMPTGRGVFSSAMLVMVLMLRLKYFDDVEPRPMSITGFFDFWVGFLRTAWDSVAQVVRPTTALSMTPVVPFLAFLSWAPLAHAEESKPAKEQAPKECVLKIPVTLEGDPRNYYPVSLLEMAIAKTTTEYGPCKLEFTSGGSGDRNIVRIEQGQLDIIWRVRNKDREQRMQSIKIPILRGLHGYRILVIRKSDKDKFAKVKSLEDLRHFVAGTGRDWQSTDVLRFNDLPFLTTDATEQFYPMLAKGRIDYYPRAFHEPIFELERFGSPDLMIEEHLMLTYQAADYFYVRKNDSELAKRIKLGLERGIADGTRDKLQESVFGLSAMVKTLKPETRRMIKMKDPPDVPEPGEVDPSHWLDPSAISKKSPSEAKPGK